jgi:hypothetical protein
MPKSIFNAVLDEVKPMLKTLASKQGRKAFASQVEYVIMPIYLALNKYNRAIIAATMGTGKTTMANMVSWLLFLDNQDKGFKTLFLAAGSKHLKKMVREALATIPGVKIFVISNTPRARFNEVSFKQAALMRPKAGEHFYFVMSKDSNKSSWTVKPMKEGQKCPCCYKILGAKEFKINSKKDIFKCTSCGEKTWSVNGGTPSAADIFKDAYNASGRVKLFDLVIADEVHEYQNPESQQAKLYRALIDVCGKTLIMTGTLSNGMASSVFHILYPLIPDHFKRSGFEYKDIGKFVDFFGTKQKSTVIKIDTAGKQRKSTKVDELPQINDRIVGFLAPFCVWFSMDDLNVEMPPLTETVVTMDINPEITQAFDNWHRDVMTIGNQVPDYHSFHFNQARHYRINNPTHNYVEVIDGEEIHYDCLASHFRTNKEKELLRLVKKEVAEGRRVLVYGVYNQSTNLYSRLEQVLQEEGYSAAFMPDKVKSEDIEEWITDFEGDVLILPQKRVATGLDLVMFHTVIFFEVDNQLRIVQQAKVRPWRPIGQDKDVRIFYLAYNGVQERNLRVMGQKMRSAATVEGELITDDSIAAIYDYNPQMTEDIAALAAKISEMAVDNIKGGRGRELSLVELEYNRMLEEFSDESTTTVTMIEVKTEVTVDVVEEPIVKSDTITMIEVKTEIVEDIIEETISKSDIIAEVIIETKETVPVPKEINIKVTPKQLTFDF